MIHETKPLVECAVMGELADRTALANRQRILISCSAFYRQHTYDSPF